MYKLLLVFSLSVVSFCLVSAQGVIQGKITDEKGIGIPKALIKVLSNEALNCYSDNSGCYSLLLTARGSQLIEVSAKDHQLIQLRVFPSNREVIVLDLLLKKAPSNDSGNRFVEKAIKNTKEVQITNNKLANLQQVKSSVSKNTSKNVLDQRNVGKDEPAKIKIESDKKLSKASNKSKNNEDPIAKKIKNNSLDNVSPTKNGEIVNETKSSIEKNRSDKFSSDSLGKPNFGKVKLKGKISDESGGPIIGALVSLNEFPSVGTVSDFDGNFELIIPREKLGIVKIAYLGFKNFELNLANTNEKIIIKDVTLVPESTKLDEVEIVSRQEKAAVYYMENIKKRSASTIDYVSSQSMKLSGDNNAASAVARVSGVSTNGSFITVRGIGDRYIKTTINGSQIPTLDPFTNNIKLDIIPSSLIDNIVLTKTSSPDLPGSWTGAYISVDTKDYPDKLNINIETQIGYNEQSSFKSILANDVSKTDWLGFDNSYRDRNHNNFLSFNPDVTSYQELVALGLGQFYKSIGVTKSWDLGNEGDVFYKLGLVELGLLPKAQFNDPMAFIIAKERFVSEGYKDKAFAIINKSIGAVGKSFPNNWNLYNKKSSPNFSQTFSLGNQSKLFGRGFGYIFGFRYGSTTQYDPNAITERTLFSSVDTLGKPQLDEQISYKNVKYINGWSGLVNLSYKIAQNHSLSLLFMPNFIGVNSLRDGISLGDVLYKFDIRKDQFYEQRRQMVYQIKSENYLPHSKIKIEFQGSYTKGNSSAPDFKRVQFFADDNFEYYYDKTRSTLSRDFRYLAENLLDSKLSFEIPFFNKPTAPRKLKFGLAYQEIQRFNDQYSYSLNFNSGLNNVSPYVKDNDLNKYFSTDRFDVLTKSVSGTEFKTIDFFYTRLNNPADHTLGISKIGGAYSMLDFSLNSTLRISGGLRVEQTDLLSDAKYFHDNNYERNDLRRLSGSVFLLNPGKIKGIDFLPTVNLIYRLRDNENNPINLRLNYGKTLARPSLREISESIVYDYELNAVVYGNSELKLVKVDNYDLRFESFGKSGNNISISLFYKNFKNHIELVQGYSWANAENSYVKGIELEGKLKLVKGLELKSNLSLVNSKTTIIETALTNDNGVRKYIPIDTVTRKMFGQAPYVINGILSYSIEKIGLVSTISYNIQGPRLVLTSFGLPPNIYELPRHLLDAKISKTIGKHFGMSIAIRDILKAPIRRSYKFDSGYLLDYDRFNYGTTYTLGISYKL